jgi:polyphenol oxidase
LAGSQSEVWSTNLHENKIQQGANMLFKKIVPNRREVCAAIAATTLASVGLHPQQAAADDNPVDCAPIGAAGKNPVAYTPDPSLPVRIRKSAFELDSAEVDRLKAAYAALRKLTKEHPNDPRGWLRQGYVHCWYCGGGGNGQEGEEIHGSWFFFPWHRAYLHFHERILCRLINDDNFALPYWDWDSEGRQTFPKIYGDPSDPSNPLFDMLRSAKAGQKISTQAVSAAILNSTMNQSINSLFMGSDNGDSGAMENAPHGPVHIWTGDTTLQNANPDMGVLATAAQDPVFFAHHGNIDRLWSVWLGLSPNHKNFTSKTWTQHPWQFYNEDAVWTQITIEDVLDPMKSLRSDYAKPDKAPIWTFKPRASPSVAASAASGSVSPPLVLANATAVPIPLGTAPVTRGVALPRADIEAFGRLSASPPAQYVLHVRGIEVPNDEQALFNVFLNLPDATAGTSLDAPNFVGTVTVLAKTKVAHEHRHAPTNVAFDVTDVLSKVKGPEQLSVTLVPAAAERIAPNASQATFREISLERI